MRTSHPTIGGDCFRPVAGILSQGGSVPGGGGGGVETEVSEAEDLKS